MSTQTDNQRTLEIRKVGKEVRMDVTEDHRRRLEHDRATARSKLKKKQNKTVKQSQKNSSATARVLGASDRMIKCQKARVQPYFDSRADPWSAAGVICPVSLNPAPTMRITTARTTRYAVISVTNNTSTQICLLPGHGGGEDSQHSAYTQVARVQAINGQNHPVGPIGTTIPAETGVGGVLSHSNPLNTSSNVTTGVNNVALVWDVALPYSFVASNALRARWQLVSMGIKIFNTTVGLDRGGSVVSVIPSNRLNMVDFTLQSQYDAYDTFEIHGSGENGISIVWTPLAEDLMYWTATNTLAHTVLTGPGILVWLNADATKSQTYQYEVTYNWMLGGDQFRGISKEVVHHPSDANIVEPANAIALLKNAGSSVHKIGAALLDGVSSETIINAVKTYGPRVAAAAGNAAGLKLMG